MTVPSRTWLGLAGAAFVLVGALVFASLAHRGPQTLEERTQAVASSLRCPVCQNLSVADSPSGLGAEMRAAIQRRLRAGETPDEIRTFFVQRYGEWVLLAPPRRGLDLVPWIAPIAGLALGLGLWVRFLLRRPAPEAEEVTA